MFKELDVVKANRKINGNLPEGTKGVIHQVYLNNPNFYLVEFVDDENYTISILEVDERDLELI
jgi:hypothetical protein